MPVILCGVNNRESIWKRTKTHFDKIQIQDHVYGRSDFVLETVHLKTHALKDNFCASRERDLLQQCRHLRAVKCRRREEHIELDWEKPERCDVILTGLKAMRQHDTKQFKVHTSCIIPLIVLWTLTR